MEDHDSSVQIVMVMEIANMFKNEPSCTVTWDCLGPLGTDLDNS